MKIVIDARESGTSTGRYIDKLVEYLYALKPEHHIIVATKEHRVDFMKNIAPGFEVRVAPFKEFSFAEQLGFKRFLDRLQADLVHFGMVQQPLLYRGRAVTTMHDLTTARFKNPSKNPFVFGIKQRVYVFVNRYVPRKSRQIIVPSEYVKEDVLSFAGLKDANKITVTYEAADPITVPPEPVDGLGDSPFLLYVGRPTPHKNLERLIEAFQLLRQAHPDLKLVLGGKKDVLYERIEQLLKRQGVVNVMFTGFVSEGQLRWLYENCAAYVFPSLSEGFGLPGLEAMIHGAPVVSSNATCLPEIYGEAARYFDPNEPERIAAAIDDVLTDAALRNRLIVAGKERARLFSWRRMAEQTLEVYEKALKE